MASTTADYLSTKTNDLTTQAPVDPSQAREAQIPLQGFTLPIFPPEAFTAGLTSLILTSDIKLDEYTQLLEKPFAVPDLPPSITSLTLELFSLGYPPGFLTALGQKLPNIKSITLYSQLFAGTTPASREDAVAFIKSQQGLQELHLLDVFGPSGFFTDFGNALTSNLKFLEVNFTFRHSDPEFLKTVPSKEVGALVKKGLLGLTVSVSSPDILVDDEDDREGTEVGVMVAGIKEGSVVAERAGEVGRDLIMCDLTMFELEVDDMEKVLDAVTKVKILGLAVSLENWWDEVLKVIGKKERGFEVLELVGVPGVGLVERLTDGEEVQLKKEDLDTLSATCKALKSVKTSILRTKVEQWVREGDAWEKKP